MIDKFVGDVDSNGFLVNPAPLISAGIIPATVDIILPAFDVDVNGTPPPEKDELLFNGQSLGSLTGDNNIWKLNTFSVDIRKIKFPSRPAPGGNVTPVTNKFQLNIDTLSSGRWCTSIDWIALIIPIQPKLGLELTKVYGNDIRENTGSKIITTIYQQEFDAACNITTKIGPIDDYPFSGSSNDEVKLKTKLKICPENSIEPPEIKAEWTVNGGGLKSSKTWTGFEDDITIKMPKVVGSNTVDFTYSVNATDTLNVSRKLFVTKSSPLASVNPPRIAWYEKATNWASGKSDDTDIIKGILDGLYGFGKVNWRYGYFGPRTRSKCDWLDLVNKPITCNYADCYVFSDVLKSMSETLGVSGLSKEPPITAPGGNQFITTGSPSLDPAFRGSAKPVGGGGFDRYHFSSHSLVSKGTSYYDATFDGIYNSKTKFIAFNETGKTAIDASGREYNVTSEGAKIYDLFSSHYDGWPDYEYTIPTSPILPGASKIMALAAISNPLTVQGISYKTVDTNGDGVYEGLVAEVDLNVLIAGTYTVVGRLEKNSTIIANRPIYESQLSSRVTFTANNPGINKVIIEFSGEQIFQSGQNGPYDLLLKGNNFNATSITPAYDYRIFGEISNNITGISDISVDSNNNGKFEEIQANVQLFGKTSGNYRLVGGLTKSGNSLVTNYVDLSIGKGTSTVKLVFPGLPLKRSGQDGPYQGSISLYDENGDSISTISFATKAYRASDFESVIDVLNTSQTDQGVDTDGNGLFNTLAVNFGASFSQNGTFLVTGILSDENGTKTVFSEQLLTVTSGTQVVKLEFAGPDIYGLELNGPYLIEVSLRDPASQTVIDRVRLPEKTKTYAFTQFDASKNIAAIELTGGSIDKATDTNGNGLYDQLKVDVGVKLKNAGTYTWSARLVDSLGVEIGFYNGNASLVAGNAQISFIFDGLRIGKNGRNGPYFVKSLLMFGGGANLVATEVATTAAYNASDFEGYVKRVRGDLNGDGKVDAADVALLQKALGSVIGSANYNPDADLDGDGRVTINDLRILRSLINKSIP